MRFASRVAVCMGLVAFAAISAAADAAPPERQRHAKAKTTGSPRIICGMTGCFEIPPGCRGEIRPNGNGIIAVVICDRR